MSKALIAYCGLYCGACSFKVAYEENEPDHLICMPAKYDKHKGQPLVSCGGCKHDLERQCGDCDIRSCAVGRKIEHCGLCSDFPCDKITTFNDDGTPHHGETINNLALLRELGEDTWLEQQEKQWTCQCGSRLSWYRKECPNCSK